MGEYERLVERIRASNGDKADQAPLSPDFPFKEYIPDSLLNNKTFLLGRRFVKLLLALQLPIFILILLFSCGTLSLLQTKITIEEDTRSLLAANYQPWPYEVVQPIRPEIIEEIQKDQGGDLSYESIQEAAVAGWFWITAEPGADTENTNAVASVRSTATLEPSPDLLLTSTTVATGSPTLKSETTTATNISSITPTSTGTTTPSSTFASTTTMTATITHTVIACGPPSDWVIYIVQSGDTLNSISFAYVTTVTELQEANCLGTSTSIFAGMILFVPNVPTVTPVPTNTHTVVPTSTQTRTPTDLPLPAPTNTSIPPSNTPVGPTATFTETSVAPLPTSTFTPTETSTSTVTLDPSTPTLTSTATNTSTSTPTNTLVPDTLTPTLTPTETLTSTVTQTPTLTLTNTVTNTVTTTPTLTNTTTSTPTNTVTNTVTLTPTNTNTPTPTNTTTSTPTNTVTNTVTSTPTNTNTLTPTNTSTSTPTNTNTPTATATSTDAPRQIAGRVFEDTNYTGGDGTAYGAGDTGLQNVAVEVYQASILVDSTMTDVSGNYTLTVPANGTYTLRVVSATIGDADTPPSAGFNLGYISAIAEQTYEHNGTTGNGASGALGGNDPTVVDTATAIGAGEGDTNVQVVVSGANISGVDFGFTYDLIVNTFDSSQGSLRQFIENAEAIAGANIAQFNIPIADPNFNTLIGNAFVIQPLTPYPDLQDSGTILDGNTQEVNRGNQRVSLPDIVIDGINLGFDDFGFEIKGSGCTLNFLDIRRFNNGNATGVGTAILIDGAISGDNNTISNNYITLNSSTDGLTGGISIAGAADNNIITANNVINNFGDGIRYMDDFSTGNLVTNNSVTLNGDDGIRLNGDSFVAFGNSVAFNQRLSASACGVELLSVTNSSVFNNAISNNGIEGGICLIWGTSTDNVIGPNNTIYNNAGPGLTITVSGSTGNQITENSFSGNNGLAIDLNNDGITWNDSGDFDTGPNDYLNYPVIYWATLSGGNLTVAGEVRTGRTVEFYIAAVDPTNYGEGYTFIASRTEGSIEDSTADVGIFDSSARQFRFTFPAPGVSSGTQITAIAIGNLGNTSEFSMNYSVP